MILFSLRKATLKRLLPLLGERIASVRIFVRCYVNTQWLHATQNNDIQDKDILHKREEHFRIQ